MTPLRAQGVSTRVCSGESLGGRNEAMALLGDGRPRTQGPRKVLSSPKGFLESLGSSASAASEPPKDYGKPLGGRSRPPSPPSPRELPRQGRETNLRGASAFPPALFGGKTQKGGPSGDVAGRLTRRARRRLATSLSAAAHSAPSGTWMGQQSGLSRAHGLRLCAPKDFPPESLGQSMGAAAVRRRTSQGPRKVLGRERCLGRGAEAHAVGG